MANPYRGETTVKFGEREFVLQYSLEALAQLEDKFGKTIQVIMKDLTDPEKPSLRVLQSILFVGLLEHHPEITLEEVGRLGMPNEIMDAVSTALYGKSEEPTDEPRPQ